MFLRCWKRKKARRRHENPLSALPKDGETLNWQHDNPAPPSTPENSSESCSCPSTEIQTSSTITGRVGDSDFIYPGFPTPPPQVDTDATATFSKTTCLTSVRIIEDGDSGAYHTASDHELATPSPDTTSTFVTLPETNNDVLPDKGHVNNSVMKTKSPYSHSLSAPPNLSQDCRVPLVRENEGEGSSHVCPNRVRSFNQTCLPSSPSGMALNFSRVFSFSYEQLARATDQFSSSNLLGRGGFGLVHKGILPNGDQVAVKQLKIDSRQGDREFQAEVEIISLVHHKHLVSLVGYCKTDERRILVYEFVPNNSLKFHLHGNGRPAMEWSTRVKIALGSAKGLAYLHEDCHPKIIHRDIKSDNILLDRNCGAKIADFGLARIFPDDNTHIEVTQVMGTAGYMDPGCVYSRRFTTRSDVFSFGVMVLELITGRLVLPLTESSGACSLVEWACPLLEARNYDMLVDPRLQGNYNTYEMARVAACAAACVRFPPRSRPRMSQIVRSLEGHLSLDPLNASTMESIDSPGIYSPGLYIPSPRS